MDNTNNNVEKFNELKMFIDNLSDKDQSSLIKVLHRAQHIFGYLPKEVQIFVSEQLDIPVSKIYGVISFYSYFTDVACGKNIIHVCIGTGCFVRGADKIMKAFEDELNIKAGNTTADMNFTLTGVRCVGACGLAPVVIINRKVYGHVKVSDVKEILENYIVDDVMNT